MIIHRLAFLVIFSFSTSIYSVEVYFSSQHSLREKLCDYIACEKKSIKGAVYFFTDKQVAKALCDALTRGVHIELIACKTAFDGPWSQVTSVAKKGIDVSIYKSGDGIMHHKFFIFESNKQHKSYVWTGSYNPTNAATKKNCENVIIEDDGDVIIAYTQEFDRLKKGARSYKSTRSKQENSLFQSTIIVPNSMENRLTIQPER